MKILLLSGYDADSHRYWWKGLLRHLTEHHWTVLTLPPRYFSWRIRGNSLSWAFGERERLEADYDLVIATSMVDLSSLRGFVPSLGNIPTLVYFHENQFEFPASAQQQDSLSPQIVNLYSALCADQLCFNSEFNRSSFFKGAAALLKKLPDAVPTGLIERLQRRSKVLPVPLFEPDLAAEEAARRPENEPGDIWPDNVALADRPLRVLWAARWEYDKGPELLNRILAALEKQGVNYQLCLLGQRFRNSPEVFDLIQDTYSHRLVQSGFVPSKETYLDWLAAADVVLSTAIHEFQGLAVLEAIDAGCIPVLPNRLVYPEWVPESYLYANLPTEPALEAEAAAALLCDVAEGGWVAPDISGVKWSALEAPWRACLRESAGKNEEH